MWICHQINSSITFCVQLAKFNPISESEYVTICMLRLHLCSVASPSFTWHEIRSAIMKTPSCKEWLFTYKSSFIQWSMMWPGHVPTAAQVDISCLVFLQCFSCVHIWRLEKDQMRVLKCIKTSSTQMAKLKYCATVVGRTHSSLYIVKLSSEYKFFLLN